LIPIKYEGIQPQQDLEKYFESDKNKKEME